MPNVINGTSTGSGGLITTGDDSGILNIQTNETTAITIDASQNVGIGTTPASGVRLDIRSNNVATLGDFRNASSTGYGIYVAASGSTSQYVQRWADYNNNALATIDGAGNLLVGTTSNAALQNNNSLVVRAVGDTIQNHANGTSSGAGYLFFGYNAGAIGSITQSGTTAVLYNTTSDQRLKENIKDSDSASNLIDSLKVRQFDWKFDNSHQRYGFVAQELVTVAPEAVYQPEDTEQMMAVDYSKLVPMLVKEIQSLRQRLSAANL